MSVHRSSATSSTPFFTADSVRLKFAGYDKPFLEIPTGGFCLPEPGVYTLEGPNGCGKSMLFRWLTGTLPSALGKPATRVHIKGEELQISGYTDALRAGIVSVFQDDQMIPSMTVLEYCFLLHGKTTAKQTIQFVYTALYNQFLAGFTHGIRLLSTLIPLIPNKFRLLLDRLEMDDIDWGGHNAIKIRAEELLKRYDIRVDLLDKLPTKLSGGFRAAAKLVAIKLHTNTRILLLDECFNGVEKHLWPLFIDDIKQWSIDNKTAVIAISHSKEELLRWSPKGKFEIANGKLVQADTFSYGLRKKVRQTQTDYIPIFELKGDPERDKSAISELARLLKPSAWVILHDTADELDAVRYFNDTGLPIAAIDYSALGTENPISFLEANLRKVQLLKPRLAFVATGGPTTKSCAAFGAISQGEYPGATAVFVATTLDGAFTDVLRDSIDLLIGPTTSTRPDTRKGRFTPDAYVMASACFKDGAALDNYAAVTPLRLGLLFNENLFEKCESILNSGRSTKAEALEVFQASVRTLNQISEIDSKSGGVGRSLLYGEALGDWISTMAPPNTSSQTLLILGMLLEAFMTNSEVLALRLSRLLSATGASSVVLPALSEEMINHARNLPNMEYGDKECLRLLAIESIGFLETDKLRSVLIHSGSPLAGVLNYDLSSYANETVEGITRLVGIDELPIAWARLTREVGRCK